MYNMQINGFVSCAKSAPAREKARERERERERELTILLVYTGDSQTDNTHL